MCSVANSRDLRNLEDYYSILFYFTTRYDLCNNLLLVFKIVNIKTIILFMFLPKNVLIQPSFKFGFKTMLKKEQLAWSTTIN